MRPRVSAIFLTFLAAFAPCRMEGQALGRSAGAGRTDNSAELRSFLDSIERNARELGLSASRLGFSTSVDADSSSSSELLRVDLPGSPDRTLVIFVPVTPKPDGDPSRDGSLGADIALALMKRLAPGNAGASVRFLFSGAEYGVRLGADGAIGPFARLGARRSAFLSLGEKGVVVMHLDLSDPSEIPVFDYGAEERLAPFWLRELAASCFRASGFGYVDEPNRVLARRLGLADEAGPLQPWLESGIPALGITGRTAGGAFAPTNYDSLVDALAAMTSRLPGEYADTWDKQYFLFEFAGRTLVVRELHYVIALLTALAALIVVFAVSSFVRRRHLIEQARFLPLFLLVTAALFAALSLAVWAASSLSGVAFDAFATRGALGGAAAAVVVLRFAALAFAFMALSAAGMFVRAVPVNPNFYAVATVLVSSLDFLFVLGGRLSLSVFFFWILAFAVVAAISRRLWTSALVAVIAPLPMAALLADALREPQRALWEFALFPSLREAIFLALLFFPFALLVLSIVARPVKANRRRAVPIAMTAFLLAVAALAGEQLVAAAFANRRPAIATLVERQARGDGSQVSLVSDRTIPEGAGLTRDGASLVLTGDEKRTGRVGFLPPSPMDFSPKVASSVSYALGRQLVTLDIECRTAPYRLELELSGTDTLSVYECSLPVSFRNGGTAAFADGGPHPPARLRVELAVARGFTADFVARAVYLEHPAPFASARTDLVSLARQRLVAETRGAIGKADRAGP